MWVPYKSIAYGQLAQFSLQHEDLRSWNSAATSELGPWRKTRIQHPANEWLRNNEAPIENSAGCWRWRCGQVRQPLDGHGARRKQCLLQRFANHSSYVVLPKVFPSVSSILSVFLQFLSWRQRAAFYRFPSMSSILFLQFFTEAVFVFRQVILGEYDRNCTSADCTSIRQVIDIDQKIIHGQFGLETVKKYDIALLRLAKKVSISGKYST